MKILFVDQTGQLGGGELSLFDIVTHLGMPAEVVLFSTGPFHEALVGAGVKVHVLDSNVSGKIHRKSGSWSALSATPALWNLQRKIARLASSGDVIYANSQKAFIAGALAARTVRKPLVWHLRDMLTADHFSPVLRRVAIYLANRYATVVIANSKATQQSFLDSGGRASLVRVVYNGISPAPFENGDPATFASLRTKLAPDPGFLVGVFGRLSPWKGQHVMLEALLQLPDVQVVFVGEALFGEDEYAAQLRSRSEDPALQGRVHFAGFRKDVPALMRAVDAVALTSISPEPFGRVIVEGMLAGKPVIATRAGGALEIIRDRETGLLVEPGNPQDLAAAIHSIQQDKRLAARLGAQGRHAALTQFSLDAMVGNVRSVLLNLPRRQSRTR